MPSRPAPLPRLQFRLLTPGGWPDLVRLFGERGACGGCWCMWWRLARSRFLQQKGAGNRRAFKRIVDAGEASGLLAYCDGDASHFLQEDAPERILSGIERFLDAHP